MRDWRLLASGANELFPQTLPHTDALFCLGLVLCSASGFLIRNRKKSHA